MNKLPDIKAMAANKLVKYLILINLILMTGCANWMTRPNQLLVKIEPIVITPGCIVSVEVTSPSDLKTLTGKIDYLGAPVVLLKAIDKKHWVWRTQIPLEAAWKSGRYHVVFEGRTKTGGMIFGEAWVEAP